MVNVGSKFVDQDETLWFPSSFVFSGALICDEKIPYILWTQNMVLDAYFFSIIVGGTLNSTALLKEQL